MPWPASITPHSQLQRISSYTWSTDTSFHPQSNHTAEFRSNMVARKWWCRKGSLESCSVERGEKCLPWRQMQKSKGSIWPWSLPVGFGVYESRSGLQGGRFKRECSFAVPRIKTGLLSLWYYSCMSCKPWNWTWTIIFGKKLQFQRKSQPCVSSEIHESRYP